MEESLAEVSVVILNYNTRHQLDRFLPQVMEHSDDARIVVADNGSSDHSAELVREKFPSIELLTFYENHGFCGGYNRALAQVKAKYYVLLNSDIETTDGWLRPLIKTLEQRPEIAAVQPKIRAHYSKGRFEHAGAAGGYIDRLGYPFCRGRLFEHVENDDGQYDDSGEIFWASGACMVIRAELYHEFGGLDEKFFAHMEEIDLCWRMHQAGYKVWYCHDSCVYHVGGGTLNASSPLKTFLQFSEWTHASLQNLPASQLLPKLIWRLVLDGIAGVRLVTQGRPAHCWQIIRAHIDFYGHLPYLIKVRSEQSDQGRLDALNSLGYYPRTLIWDVFVKGKKKFSELLFPKLPS